MMSELTFGSPDHGSSRRCSMASNGEQTAIFRAVPTDESIAADVFDNLEYNESATRRLDEEKLSTLKGKKRRPRKTLCPSELDSSEISGSIDNSMNFSAVQSAILLPNKNSLLSNIEGNNASCSNSNISSTNLINHHLTNNETSVSAESPQVNDQNIVINMKVPENKYDSSDYDTSNASENQLNSTYITSETSSYLSDTSSQSSLRSRGANKKKQNISTSSINNSKVKFSLTDSLKMPPIEELNEPEQKPKKQAKNNGTKKAVRVEPKTKSKGTQVNVKTKSAKPKQRKPGKKKNEVKQEEKQINKQANEIVNDPAIELNNLNIAKAEQNVQKQLNQKLLEERMAQLLEMPCTSHQVRDINNNNESYQTESHNSNLSIAAENISPQTEVLISDSCSIEIVKEANNSKKISIVLPPDSSLFASKKKKVTHERDTPARKNIKVKQEKTSPKIIDLTSENKPVQIKQEKESKKKISVKNPKNHKSQHETERANLNNKKSTTNRPKKKYDCTSSESSEDSEESSCDCSDCDADYSDRCNCSDCSESSSCYCKYCNDINSCSCSDCCSDSSNEANRRRRRHY